MFKTFFITRQPENEIDRELERTLEKIQMRMDKMLAAQEADRLNFALTKATPSYYR